MLLVRAASHPALDGFPVAWFAPNYRFLTEAWRNLRRRLLPITSAANKQERRIELATGGSIDFWSLTDDDAGRSYKYKRAIVDEAGLVNNMDAIWYEAIRPTLTDYRGDVWIAGTPKGRNFFHTAFLMGQDPQETEWSSWQRPTVNNPTIDGIEAEVEAARKGMPERSFAQEYLAEFLEDGGGVFRRVRDAVDAGRTENEAPKNARSYTMGVDLARVNDWTILIVMDDLGRQVYYERFNQISWERQVDSIVEVARRYSATVYIDSTGVGDPVFEMVQKRSVPCIGYTLSAKSKPLLIDHLAICIEHRSVRLMDIAVQTNELQAYEYQVSSGGGIKTTAPSGMHDDTVIALALATWGAVRRLGTIENGERANLAGKESENERMAREFFNSKESRHDYD